MAYIYIRMSMPAVPTLQHTEKALIGLLLLAHEPMPDTRRAVMNSLYSLRWMADKRIRKTCSSFTGNVVLSTEWLRLQPTDHSHCSNTTTAPWQCSSSTATNSKQEGRETLQHSQCMAFL